MLRVQPCQCKRSDSGVSPVEAHFGGWLVISNLRSRAMLVPEAAASFAADTGSPARTPRTVEWHSSSVPLAKLHKCELQLHHRKHVLHFRAHPRLGPVLRPLHFINTILVAVAPMSTVLSLRCALPDHFALSAIGLIAPHSRFFAVQ